MKIQVRKWLLVVATLVSLMFVVAGLEAKKGGGGKPDKPGDTGEAAALICELVDHPGSTDPGTDPDTVLSDGLGDYEDGVDKVGCGHGGTVQPNLSGIQLNTVSKGATKRAIRKIDLAFGECVGPGPNGEACQHVPDAFLFKAGSVEGMEDIWIGTGPYPDDPEMTHIQLMDPGKWEMKSHMSVRGFTDLFIIQLMNRDTFPLELGQGLWCNLERNPAYNWANAKTDEDMTVCIWPDNDGDSRPDGYTITTGDTDCLTTWPEVYPRERLATICSAAGPYPCEGDMCNLLGTVPLQLTIHATYQ